MARQPALALDAAAIAGERTIGADHPVARDDETDRVGAVGQPHRPHCRRLADALCQRAIAQRRAGRDGAQGGPDRALKRRAAGRALNPVQAGESSTTADERKHFSRRVTGAINDKRRYGLIVSDGKIVGRHLWRLARDGEGGRSD